MSLLSKEIEELSRAREAAWRELGHPPTIHSRHLAAHGKLADEVSRIERRLALAYSVKRQERAGRPERRPTVVSN